jgi:hypothetical protein
MRIVTATLAVNARCTPSRIFPAHPADEISNLAGKDRASRLSVPHLPRPKPAKPLAMPGHDGFWFHDDQGRAPRALVSSKSSTFVRHFAPLRNGMLALLADTYRRYFKLALVHVSNLEMILTYGRKLSFSPLFGPPMLEMGRRSRVTSNPKLNHKIEAVRITSKYL